MKLLVALVLLISPLGSQARWATTKEAGYAVVFESAHYKIETGGRYVVEAEREIEILKENERLNMGLTRMVFDAHASEYELIEAYTKNGDKITQVKKEHVEIKPMASSGAGFDEQRQVTIAFPDVNVGSHVYYKYRRTIKQAPISGVFAAQYPVGWGEWQRGLAVTFDSAVPIFWETHDPEKALEVSSLQVGNRYRIEIKLRKPLYKSLTEEEDTSMDPNAITWIAVSSAKDWASFPKETPAAYEKILDKGELPAKFAAIFEKAKAGKNDVDQINLVTSQLASSVRYVGDWVPVEGLCHPRPLQVVADTGFGDCKDFSTVTATILRKLGFDTHVAWTNRGVNWIQDPLNLPTATYNHAIVFAKKNGREFWVDPTNSTSFAQGVYEDIAGREALILDPDNLRPQIIESATAAGSSVAVDMEVRFEPNHISQAKGEFSLGGRSVIGMTGSELSWEKKHLDYQLVSWLTDASNLLDWHFPDYNFSSRVVNDFKTKFDYRKRWNPLQTSAGPGIMVPAPPYIAQFQFRRAERVSGLYLPDPKTWKRRIRFVGKKAVLKDQPACEIKSPWLDFSRRFRLKGSALELAEVLSFKKSPIPISDILTPAFATLQEQVADCLQPPVVVFQ